MNTDAHGLFFLRLARATVSDLDRFNLATAVFLEPFQGVVVAVDQFNLLAYFRSFAGLRFGLGCVGECAWWRIVGAFKDRRRRAGVVNPNGKHSLFYVVVAFVFFALEIRALAFATRSGKHHNVEGGNRVAAHMAASDLG